MQKIAVIGSGAAGAGAVMGLLDRGVPCAIDVFDAAEPIPDTLVRDSDPRGWKDGHMADIYRRTARSNGLSVPLPKSFFGFTPERTLASGKKRIWHSAFRGGLTNFWGGTMLPLAPEDFEGWPVAREEMLPWYARACEAVGVSGRDDALAEALGGFDPSNRPPIRVHGLIEDFMSEVNASGPQARAGANRIALETRPERDNACVFCGECLIGCFKGAPFSTASMFRRWQAQGVLNRLSSRRIHAIDPKARRLVFANPDGTTELSEPYDKIMLGAGCMGSTSILMNTLDLNEAAFEDSRVVNVPIVFTALRPPALDRDGAFGLTHGLVIFRDERGRVESQAQLYPTLPHFWRSVVPSFLWGIAGFFGLPLRRRLLWARVYLPSDAANVYRLRRDDGTLEASIETRPAGEAAAAQVLRRLRDTLRGTPYRVIGPLAKDGGSSSHYAAAAPFCAGGPHVDREFRLTEDVIVIDSTAWPSAPAMSPTLSIMANAMRLAANVTPD